MPRPRNAVPSRPIHLHLAEEDAARLELHLWSTAEQRLPYAARQRFFTERLREYFSRASLDLAQYFPYMAPGSVIYGPKDLLDSVAVILQGHAND